MTNDIVARLRVWSDWLDERCPDTEVRNDLRAAADEIERLRKNGCARDQRTTQFCTEAVALQREVDRLRGELKAWQDAHRAHPDEFGGNPE